MAIEIIMALRILLAAVLGAIIGFQREKAGKQAGLRTHILICVGSALFTLASIYGFGSAGDPARIAAGVVVGVGFLEAGVIFRRMGEGAVAGLTTAATMWVMAGVGMTAGAGLYLIAILTTIIILVVLVLPHRLD